MTTARAIALASTLLHLLPSCDGSGSVSAPVVRVDLRSRLPEKLQRQLAVADLTYECRKSFKLAARGAEQAFLATWRVLDDGKEKFITAVEVNPEGPTHGAGAPSASALVEEAEKRHLGSVLVSAAAVRVSWTASKGCSKVEAATRLELRADDPGCQRPKGPGKLLVPVR